MLDKVRGALRTDRLKRSVRDKLMRAVDEVVARHRGEQSRELDAMRHELAEIRRQLHDQSDYLREAEERAHRDIVFGAEREAAADAGDFAARYMSTARHFPHPHQTLEYGLSIAPEGGLALEFGVFTGTTLKIISAARGGEGVYGFDSFEGLPDDWRLGFPAGTFQVDGLPDVPGAELVVGWFADTLPDFLAAHPEPVDLLHIDGDLYSSARTVLELVGPRLRVGSIVVFDEFFNYPGWREHEFKAWQEYLAQGSTKAQYEAYTHLNEQVVVRITDV
ncbi:class I SAM-dependent methyltransferase [Actinokineospora sp.]|uniref:class I SAM-dependent methyltransferase n=1 Tax=Actinokineospora sp. TaxID=1872133 RepID=UPI0040378E3D